MQIRGNYILFFMFELITGLLVFSLCWLYGDVGLWAIGLFFIGMALTMKPTVDEREIQFLYKAGSTKAVILAAAMALIYFYAPQINWFHSFISVAMVSRGALGIFYFVRG